LIQRITPLKSQFIKLLVVVAAIALTAALFLWSHRRGKERQFDDLIRKVSRKYEVDPALVKAVIWRESRFDALAEGRVGELGLMQIREAAAGEWAAAEKIPEFAFEQLRDPVTNTMAGTWYLARLLRRYDKTDDPVVFALADYNAGRSNVLRWNTGNAATNASAFIQQITFPGTRHYVESVRKQRDGYRTRFSGEREP
jgi:soluble lytic murein transglycosylase